MSQVPPSVLEAIRAADRPDAGPRPGELWRVRAVDGHSAALVVVRTVEGAGIEAAPVTFDVEFADDTTTVVGADVSPLGIDLAIHAAAASIFDRDDFIDRFGRLEGDGATGPPIVSPLDERAEFAASLLWTAPSDDDDDEWWPVDMVSGELGELLLAIHAELTETRPAARVVPRPDGVALVSEMDAFVLVVAGAPSLDVARDTLLGDQLLSAVCMVERAAPHLAVVIDRRDVVDAIETPSGELRPPRRTRDPAPIGEVLVKYLDHAISPFGRLVGTVVDSHALDPRDVAVDAAAEAVRAVEASARGFKVEGKRPGYERVGRHKPSIVGLIEAALADPAVDVTPFLEQPE